ncbi:hypothetical protein [Micromonospora sp. WMMD1082]|uniref:hypothetical protein n=1 Tax=Micromonospora sp. WMMD1082 TaxID=3016104 RepID=UPI0024163424|nr:hypothetical protein [Micromonospora sp. WMMD1082]MDG4792706.1 hypothetical protein [Micromonospora sp. WMMD1082]
MTRWRYIAQHALTRAWVDWDVPLRRDELTWALSGPGSLRGTISPEYATLRGPDGQPILTEWGTLLYAEADGQIRWGGILTKSAFESGSWQLEASGFASYPHGIPYTGQYSVVGVDPATAFRHVWSHVQSQPDGNLSVAVDGTTTPVRLGIPGIPAYKEVQIGGVWRRRSDVPAHQILPTTRAKLKNAMTASQTTLDLATLAAFGQLDPPYNVTVGNETIRVNGRTGLKLTGLTRGVGSSDATGHNKGTYVNHAGTPERTKAAVPAEPYQLAWWDTPDCGSELDKLAQETPFDYAEEHRWAGDEIAHRIRIGYPRLGRRRDDLAFEQGVNIVSVVPVSRDGGQYANAVFGIGAGEGSKTIASHAAIRDGRLRRTAVYTDKAVTNRARMDSFTRAVMLNSRDTAAVEAIEVVDHPHAPIGSWALGDDIEVRARIPWLGDIAIWHRIVGWSLLGESRAQLQLRRSDSFIYAATPDGGFTTQ